MTAITATTGATAAILIELAGRIAEQGLLMPLLRGEIKRRENGDLPTSPEPLTDYEITLICAALRAAAEPTP